MTATVSKKSVRYTQEKLHSITFNLILTDTVEVLNKDFSVEFRAGDNIATKISEVTSQMQTVIDRYKAEQVIFNSTALNNAVTSIQGGLVL